MKGKEKTRGADYGETAVRMEVTQNQYPASKQGARLRWIKKEGPHSKEQSW